MSTAKDEYRKAVRMIAAKSVGLKIYVYPDSGEFNEEQAQNLIDTGHIPWKRDVSPPFENYILISISALRAMHKAVEDARI